MGGKRTAWTSRRARFAVMTAFGAVLFSSVAFAQILPSGTDGFIPIDDTQCWPCHKDDTSNAPLRSFANIVGPAGLHIPVGETRSFELTIQNAWLSDLLYLAPSLDLSDAPSLTFEGGPESLIDEVLDGTVSVPTTGLAEEQTARVEIPVDPAAVSLELTLAADSGPTGPDLALRIYTPRSGNSTPATTIDAGGNGAPETYSATSADLQDEGYGNWSIEAVYNAVKAKEGGASASTPDAEIPFTVTYTLLVDTGGDRVQHQARQVALQPQGSSLFTWRLKALGEPGDDETVRVAVNLTAFFEHPPNKSPVDYGYIHDERTFPVELNSTTGSVDIVAPAGGNTIVRPPGNIPVTLDRISETVGYVAAFLILGSIASGGMFGKSSRRWMNTAFGAAKRRVAFHNFLSYGLILAAIVHTVLFIVEKQYYYTLGLIWGGLAILAMMGLGFTGALQVAMIRKWSYGAWRWTHYGMAVATIVFTLLHIVLDGANFGGVQERLGWSDPLDPRDVAV